ncbi:MAG: hypothetical protein NVV73_01630 [Cellvibrionaceae bacterium]|nr:hypothetical protein [Cellvibrionaceae bacterium]
MRFKLVHKLVLVNTGIIVILTSVFVGLSYFSSKSMYSNALNGIDHEVMRTLARGLSEHYQQNGSWQVFRDNPAQWRETVDRTFFSVFFQLMAEVAKERGERTAGGATPRFSRHAQMGFSLRHLHPAPVPSRRQKERVNRARDIQPSGEL